MPSKIYSFGFRHRKGRQSPVGTEEGPEAVVHGDAIIIDVRKVLPKNPYHDRALRKLRGIDRAVQEDIEKHPGFWASVKKIQASIAAFKGPVYFGCTGGHHRSVYIAKLMAEHFDVEVEHLDIDKA